MKKSSLIHGIWLLVAVSTFAAGRYFLPADSAGTTGTESKTRILSSTENPGKASSSSSEKKSKAGADRFAASNFNAASTMAAYKNETDPLKKNFLFAELLLGLSAENAADMLAMLKDDGTRGRDMGRQMGLFFQAWGKLDGEAAVTAATEMNKDDRGGRGGPSGDMYAASAISAWAKTNPAAAEAWLATQEDGREKTMLNMGYINGLAESDPDAATAYVLSLTEKDSAAEGDRRGFDMNSRFYDMITRQQLDKGIDVAKAWADGLPDGDFKASALKDIADKMAREDLNTAKDWITKYADQDFAKDAVGEIAQRMSNEDPKAAIDWVLGLPEASQGRALYTAFNKWTETDPTAASTFLAAMPDSDTKNSAVYGFVRELDNEDPAAAAAWAVTITDDQMRNRSIMEVGSNWYKEDQAAATQFMTDNGVTAEMQQMVIQRSQGGGGGDRGGRGGFGGGGRGPGR
jgi:hypothetical protein